jgi:hypothetical protein
MAWPCVYLVSVLLTVILYFGEYILDHGHQLIRCSVLYQCVLSMCADGLEWVGHKFRVRSYKWLPKLFDLSVVDFKGALGSQGKSDTYNACRRWFFDNGPAFPSPIFARRC